ncbi:MAG TPA: (d)CMP kinase [Candidatus Hydrogenedentes bacterium]|nr:(d)CMP kinase [Candidatus Hydrogenedentota bacterium]
MSDITDIIAIDGPAGAGKSSAAKRVAQLLGMAYLDTGAMYRAATWYAIESGVNLDAPDALVASTKAMNYEVFGGDGADQRIFVDGRDVTDAIRKPEVTRNIYKLDQNPSVRDRLVALQREFGAKRPTVAEGRDIGTVVFPKAKCKIYLDASLDERARRRAVQLQAAGIPVDMAALANEINERDRRDRTRQTAPLRCPDDAVVLDTTHMRFDQVVQRIAELARGAL